MPGSIVLQLDPAPGNARNSEGAFVTLADGTLLFAWTKFLSYSASDHARSIIACRTSQDSGHTWGEERTLAEPCDAMNVMSPSFLRLADGRILFLFSRKEQGPLDTVLCLPRICFSVDETQTFSEPHLLTEAPGYYVCNNDRIVQCSNGRFILPLAMHRFRIHNVDGQPIVDGAHAGLITYLYSDDGETWFESLINHYHCFPNGDGFQEPGVIELKDGRLWSWWRMRGDVVRGGHQWQSFSEDSGHTWSDAELSCFRSPNSPLSMKRIPSTGDLFAVWNDHAGQPPSPINNRRTPLVAAISSDEGATWKHRTVLEDDPQRGYCYTAIHFHDDFVFLAYCSGDEPSGLGHTQLTMRRIALSDLYEA